MVAAVLWGLACAALARPLGGCGFDPAARQFSGSLKQQAQCLLRTVRPWGRVDAGAADVPEALLSMVGTPAATWRAALRRHLQASHIDERQLGGAMVQDSQPGLRYFVIHDTSWPWMGETAFPADDDPQLNDLQRYVGTQGVAHVFVNRLGQSLTAHGFDEPWRATKLELRSSRAAVQGVFLHIELLQPRRRAPSGPPKNDAHAPTPGFTAAQYDRLALLYAVASVRSGHWLVPALHGALDEGLADAHDDPQNFDLPAFAQAVRTLLQVLAR